jgi:pimeloyl-ACP methyl ester carboxylesterase
MPVTLVAAQGDVVSTPEAMNEFAGRCPNATFSVQADWMHMSPFVNPDRLADLIRSARDNAV